MRLMRRLDRKAGATLRVWFSRLVGNDLPSEAGRGGWERIARATIGPTAPPAVRYGSGYL